MAKGHATKSYNSGLEMVAIDCMDCHFTNYRVFYLLSVYSPIYLIETVNSLRSSDAYMRR